MKKWLANQLQRLARAIYEPPYYPPLKIERYVTFRGGPVDGKRMKLDEPGIYSVVPIVTDYGNIERVKYTYMEFTHYFDGKPEEWIAELYPTFTGADTLPI
jgi:hypothetical protein